MVGTGVGYLDPCATADEVGSASPGGVGDDSGSLVSRGKTGPIGKRGGGSGRSGPPPGTAPSSAKTGRRTEGSAAAGTAGGDTFCGGAEKEPGEKRECSSSGFGQGRRSGSVFARGFSRTPATGDPRVA